MNIPSNEMQTKLRDPRILIFRGGDAERDRPAWVTFYQDLSRIGCDTTASNLTTRTEPGKSLSRDWIERTLEALWTSNEDARVILCVWVDGFSINHLAQWITSLGDKPGIVGKKLLEQPILCLVREADVITTGFSSIMMGKGHRFGTGPKQSRAKRVYLYPLRLTGLREEEERALRNYLLVQLTMAQADAEAASHISSMSFQAVRPNSSADETRPVPAIRVETNPDPPAKK